MTEENPNTCRDIITRKDPPNSQPSYVFSIRIPRLLAKTMQRRIDGCATEHNDDHTKAKKERVIKPKDLPETVGLFFSSVFGKKKSPKASSKVHKNGDGYQSDLAETDAVVYDGDQSLLEIEEEKEEKHEKPTMETRENKPGREADKYLKVSFPFLSFLSKYTSLNFFRDKINTGNGWNHTRCNSIAIRACNIADPAKTTDHTVIRRQETSHNLPSGVGRSDTLTGRQESGSNLPTNPSRILTTRLKLKTVSFVGKTTRSQIRGKSETVREESREECGEELCKKRILMGEKCKPLNLSGSLHYDKDGILMPEA
ncbi:unnamed protein product [Dovyalis caffra]|uniref:Uncharacterized protein n=1 Tax=Dovyalis caffra TaxID=77055 RepID=A0AAV1RXP2_9ROSI|nr:unnamed protein product [Dovyalis caffra]